MNTKKRSCSICGNPLKKDKQLKNFVDGATFEISFGYPTPLDGITFSGALCVVCADRLAQCGSLKMIHNEFGEETKYIPLFK